MIRTPVIEVKTLRGGGVEEVHQRIINHFDDLYIGDYFDISITTKYCTESVRMVVADYNTMLYKGRIGTNDEGMIVKPHVAIVPEKLLNTIHEMNDTATTQGGYIGSKMYTEILPEYTSAFEKVLGRYLMEYGVLLSNKINPSGYNQYGSPTGCVSGGAWVTCKLNLMSETQIANVARCTSSIYDALPFSTQLALFNLKKDAAIGFTNEGGRLNYWLQNVISATEFALYGAAGNVMGGVAPNTKIGFRPLMYMC